MLWEGPESTCGPSTAMSRLVTRCCEKVLSPLGALPRPGVESGLDDVRSSWVHLWPTQGEEWTEDPWHLRKCSVQLRPSHSHEETQDLELWEGPESTWGPPSARCGLRTPDIVRRCWVHLCPSTALSGQDEKVLSPIVALPLLEVDLGPLTLWEGVESTCGPPQPWVDSGWKVYQFINIF